MPKVNTMMSALEIIQTEDGSCTILDNELGVTYHSIFGALQESLHIFISNGLNYATSVFGNNLNILEAGFGTGLNALLTLVVATHLNMRIRYFAVEKFPLPAGIYKRLWFTKSEDEKCQLTEIHQCHWEQNVMLNANFSLEKKKADINDIEYPDGLHLVYYDAFAPADMPEMWQEAIFKKLYKAIKKGGCLVTFCAKGDIKRMLEKVGFQVESLSGPPGKLEMTRAIKV